MSSRIDKIFSAIGQNDVILLEKLLTPQNVNVVDKDRRMTLLMYAVNLGKHEVAEFLIKRGASLYPRDLFQFNVIHHAAWRADVRMMVKLLCTDDDAAVSDMSSISLNARKKKPTFRQGTRTLVDLPHPLTNRTPLMFAAMRGDANMVNFLLTKAGADIYLKDYRGFNAMDLAAKFGHKNVVILLLSKGDDAADKAFENARRSAEENCEEAATVQQLKILKELNVLLCEDELPQSLVKFSGILGDLMRPFSDVCSAAKKCELSTEILQVSDLKNDALDNFYVKEGSSQPLSSMYHKDPISPRCCHDNDEKTVGVRKDDVQNVGVLEEQTDGFPLLLASTENLTISPLYNEVKLEDSSQAQKLHTQQLRLVRAWFARRYASSPRSSGEILDTLLRLAEDRMYLYGFDKRRERDEFLEEQRALRRKRGKAWEEVHNVKRRASGGNSTALKSFSFMRWNDAKPSNTGGLGRVPQPIDSSSVLSNAEKQMFSRYALSSGRLRKECADPYQFLMTRVIEVRRHIENDISDEIKVKENNKGAT